jgi:hypothetical protein
MRVGIIAEGKSDAAVITNLLKGLLDIDRSDIIYLVPELEYDETDLNKMPVSAFSNWTIVKQKCQDTAFLSGFFSIDDQRFLVIHIDTAERFEIGFEVITPQKSESESYVEEVRAAVKSKFLEWLPEAQHTFCTFAIAVEETEAWLLPIWDDYRKDKDSGFYPSPKERLERVLNKVMNEKERRKHFSSTPFDQYATLSKPFRKTADLNKYRPLNKSLDLFCAEIEQINQTF